MVRLAFTSLTGLIALSQLANAAPQRNIGASDSEICIAGGMMYHSGRTYNMNNANYAVRCAKDSGGNVQSVQKVSRGGFAACADACERANSCAGFTYSGNKESGNCYLKERIGDYSPSSDDIVSCHKDPKGKGEKPDAVPSSSSTSKASPPTSSTPASSSTSTSTSKASPPTSKAPASGSNSTSTSTSTSILPTSIVPVPTTASQCQEAVDKYGAVYRGGSGSAYQLSCGVDHYGGDLDNAGSASFLGCVDVCDKKPDCIGYAYTPGTCWLKSNLKEAEVNPNVDFALNLDRNATVKPPVTTSSSSSPSSSSAPPFSTSPSSTPTPQPGSCAYLAANGTSTYYNVDGTRYTIECGVDHNGGDLIRLDGRNFADCSIFCDKTPLCIAFAWTGGNGPGSCYLKSQITGRSVVSDVDYAYKDTSTYLPSSSSSSSSWSSSSVSVPVKTSSTSTSTSTPTLPPATWTHRPTWTESKASTSTHSSVSSTTKPTSSTTSSVSSSTKPTTSTHATFKTKSTHTKPTHTKSKHTKSKHTKPSQTTSSHTTLTLTHTYTRPSYSETTSSKTSHHKLTEWPTPKSGWWTISSTYTPTGSYSKEWANWDPKPYTKSPGWTPEPATTPEGMYTYTGPTETSTTKKHTRKFQNLPTKWMMTKFPKSSKTRHHAGKKSTHTLSTSVTKAPTPSTSCTTIVPSTKSTSTFSTVTSSSTKSYTQVNWVSNTGSSWSSTWKADVTTKSDKPAKPTKPIKRDPKEAGFKHSSKSHVATPSKTRHNPVRTTKMPFGDQVFINDFEFCDRKVRGTKPKYLQAKVMDGNPKYDGLWLQDPYAYNGWKAQLCESKAEAASVIINRDAQTLAAWSDRPGCGFIGFRMYHGDMTEMKQDSWLGQASFGNGTDLTATGHMAVDEKTGEFTWTHEYFDFWLICDHWEGVPVLKYKDNFHPWDFDKRMCSRAQLYWVE